MLAKQDQEDATVPTKKRPILGEAASIPTSICSVPAATRRITSGTSSILTAFTHRAVAIRRSTLRSTLRALDIRSRGRVEKRSTCEPVLLLEGLARKLCKGGPDLVRQLHYDNCNMTAPPFLMSLNARHRRLQYLSSQCSPRIECAAVLRRLVAR